MWQSLCYLIDEAVLKEVILLINRTENKEELVMMV